MVDSFNFQPQTKILKNKGHTVIQSMLKNNTQEYRWMHDIPEQVAE
jgi:hypothetical protein